MSTRTWCHFAIGARCGAIIGGQCWRAELAMLGGGDVADVVVGVEALVFGCIDALRWRRELQ